MPESFFYFGKCFPKFLTRIMKICDKNSERLQKYSLYEGGVIVVPDKPQKSGYVFKGWKNVASNQWLSDNQTADKDMMFAAVFE